MPLLITVGVGITMMVLVEERHLIITTVVEVVQRMEGRKYRPTTTMADTLTCPIRQISRA